MKWQFGQSLLFKYRAHGRTEFYEGSSYWFSLVALKSVILEMSGNGEFRHIESVWTASSEFGTYRLCEQRRFRRACASAQSRQNLRYSLIQAVSQEEPSDRKPDS